MILQKNRLHHDRSANPFSLEDRFQSLQGVFGLFREGRAAN